jgi:hypothetical protein
LVEVVASDTTVVGHAFGRQLPQFEALGPLDIAINGENVDDILNIE